MADDNAAMFLEFTGGDLRYEDAQKLLKVSPLTRPACKMHKTNACRCSTAICSKRSRNSTAPIGRRSTSSSMARRQPGTRAHLAPADTPTTPTAMYPVCWRLPQTHAMARPQLTNPVLAFNIDYPLGFENSRSGANSTAPTRPNSRIGTRPGSALSTHAGDDPMQS